MSIALESSIAASAAMPSPTRARIAALLALPLPELIFQAQTVHRQHFDPTQVQISTLLSIKTGGCPEDCGYQAARLKSAGLDYYNHNLDTSPEFYGSIITTRTYQDRLDTLAAVRDAGINVCCGGIIGMGEDLDDRAGLLATLADLDPPPESVPINALVAVKGTKLGERAPIDPIDFVRTIAAARISMPKSWVRLSAGREALSDEAQALCFLAGANSIFYGDTLLTTANPAVARDNALFDRLGMTKLS
ncbi:MAG: biotin synthase BioB [Acidiphilium sp. 21-68-69]|nr:MAG: biotin synthase BioB [Acidiphilium sp. 21-68-69]